MFIQLTDLQGDKGFYNMDQVRRMRTIHEGGNGEEKRSHTLLECEQGVRDYTVSQTQKEIYDLMIAQRGLW